MKYYAKTLHEKLLRSIKNKEITKKYLIQFFKMIDDINRI